MAGDAFPVVRAAVVQAAPVYLDRDASVEKALGLIAEAARHGAQLIAFGETWLPGYPVWLDAGPVQPLWGPEIKELHAELLRNAVAVPSPTTERLAAVAREHGVHLAMGAHERSDSAGRGTLYCSLLFFTPDGAPPRVHRKLMPTYDERMLWGQGDGSTLHVFDTPFGRLGGLCCWEHAMPLARQAIHVKGEQIHVAVWPDVDELHQILSRHYAFEGRAFVLAAGQIVRPSDLPQHIAGLKELRESDVPFFKNGGSAIIAPDTSYLAGPVYDEETILYADLDLQRIAEEQFTFDATGHYNRPDIFQLFVDVTPRTGVTFTQRPPAFPD